MARGKDKRTNTIRNFGKRPAEIFGYSISNKSDQAQAIRKRYLCPFINDTCRKRSRLISYPFGVCSVEYGSGVYAVCPYRFEEQGTIEKIPRVLEDVALHYFGDFNNVIPFPEVRLPNVGNVDYVLVRHKTMKPEVEDFVAVEFQTDSTTSTGALVQGMQEFFTGIDVKETSYKFGMNTYDTIKRSMTQLFNKGIVYESWGIKCYWVIQEYIYTNLVNRYGLKKEGFVPEHASRFVLCNLVKNGDLLTLMPRRFVSTTVDDVYQAMRNNPKLPHKDKFVDVLNKKLQAKLAVKFG